MLIQDLDLGGSHPFAGPDSGATVAPIVVEGSHTITYGRAGKATAHNVKLWVKAWQAVGGQAAGTIPALRYVLRQAQELAANRNMGPVYIRWTSSADPAAVLNAADLYDGWYWITSFNPDYTKVPSGLVPVQMQVVEVAQGGAERRVGMSYFPSAPGLSTTYSGAAVLAVGYPLNAAGLAATSVTRTAAEGSVPLTINPNSSLQPLPFSLSATTGDWFKGDVKVYDTINTSSNPVPTAGGTFVNANWVRVYDRSHRFEGDCVVTNGLTLLLLSAGTSKLCSAYVWSTGLASAAWQRYADPTYQDNAGFIGTLRSYALDRVGGEATIVRTTSSTTAGNEAEVVLRIERGVHFIRTDFRPLTQANTNITALYLNNVAANYKIAATSAGVYDAGLSGAGNPAQPTDYGWCSAPTNSASFPYIFGWLVQNQPGNLGYGAATYLGFGDAGGPAQNAFRSYAFFAIPYGVNASYSAANLQAEAESGTLSGGFVSVADGAASAGNTAKLPTGTAAGAVDLFGTSWTPPAGTYAVWWRVRNSGAASNASEVNCAQLIGGVFSAPSLILGSAQGSIATYRWLQATSTVTLTGSQTYQFRMTNSGVSAASVDWFIDEAVLVPLSLSTASTGPQDLWQQFMADRAVRLVRL